MPEAVLTEADDALHEPATDDLYWTETAWFAFAIPERRITGCIYPVFRTNQQVCSAGVYVWDDAGEGVHEVLYAHNSWHMPLPDDLRHMTLPNGLSYEVVEPLRTYRVEYRDADIDLELQYEGLIPAHPTARGGVVNHIDQPCHVTGSLRLGDERLEVDCLEMRDRSWSVRPDARGLLPSSLRAAYTYGLASPDSGFLALSFGGESGDAAVTSGLLLRDGELAPLVAGSRRAELDAGRPTKVVVEGTDDRGRSFRAEGRCVNRFAFQSSPGIFAWMSGTEWDLDDQPAWGEDQLMVPPAARVEALRAARS